MTAASPPTCVLRVAVPSPLRRLFDYLPPADVPTAALQPGQRLRVPFGKRTLVAVLVELASDSELPAAQLRPAQALLDPEPLLPAPLLDLARWAAAYYHHPWGEVIAHCLPAALRKGDPLPAPESGWRLTARAAGLPANPLPRAPKQARALAALSDQPQSLAALKAADIERPILKALADKGLAEEVALTATQSVPPALTASETPPTLSEDQQSALAALALDRFGIYLLEGATGSGKTEVYLQAMAQVLAAGRQVLLLVPEIGLTPQTLNRLQRRFGREAVLAYHSGLTDQERLRAWHAAARGSAPVIVGTRSAVFLPLARPGLIVVDEEHDASFKQQDGFRYSARDLAAWRAKREDLPLLLGSATPSLESLHNALQGRYVHLELPQRVGGARAPTMRLLDLRREPAEAGLLPAARQAIAGELAAGNQVLVFINRRGYAPTLQCQHCGWLADCPRCDSHLTVHQRPPHLHCHHCDYQRPLPRQCPNCHSQALAPLGQGTERAEEVLANWFPNVPLWRVDRDSTRRKHAMRELVAEVDQGRPGLLVGTQMLAKGHHFPDVTLVVIVDADAGLFSTDFRGPERTGQLLTQVAGRAGRAQKPGRVLVQTRYPEHPLWQLLIDEGYGAFARALLPQRQLAGLPPHRYLAVLRAESRQPAAAEQLLQRARQWLEQQRPPDPALHYLGPLPATMARRAGHHRFVLQLNAQQRPLLQPLLAGLAAWLEADRGSRQVHWSLDVDPLEWD